ncbi:unnamed protein product [Sphenostylis stenocarpa]|uniref:GATA-type domain-containing protein n=1 Tax=Sphenostylis stenocarpa TaxID=92480 RepID=A0AA86VH45_9FABA|nr:unnamed protein product [Sphenostylis stenocarpa]
MDDGESNEAPNSKVHDFDLNIPYVEDFDVNPENETSSPNTKQLKYGCEQKMKVEDAIAEVQHAAKVETAEGAISEVETQHIASVSLATPSASQGRCRRRYRRRHHHGGEAKQSSDPARFCTNFICRTRKTPMWRKGPLGPKTLCNACGLQYIKTVKSRGSDLPATVPVEGDASTVHDDDDDGGGASHGPVPVPPETVEVENL